MRREHPLWRGFWLACLWATALVLTGGTDWLAPFRGGKAPLALAAMAAVGSGLVTVIQLLRRRLHFVRPRIPRLVVCFLCGVAMALACGMVGTGRILPALMEGSVGALAFTGAAAVTGLIAARLTPGEVET